MSDMVRESKKVGGSRQEGQASPNGGNRLQVSDSFFVSPLSGRRKQTLYGNVFLKLCSWNHVFALEFAFLEMVPPKANFFFLKPWADSNSRNSIHINCFVAEGWHPSCHPVSKMHNVGEGPGETPSALRCLFYLINSFPADIKQLAITSKSRALSVSLLVSLSEASLSLFLLK